MADDKWYFQVGAVLGIIPAIGTFIGSWWYCAAEYGFLFGFGLGWLPAFILAVIVELSFTLLWGPALAAVIYFVVVPALREDDEVDTPETETIATDQGVETKSTQEEEIWIEEFDGQFLTFQSDKNSQNLRRLLKYSAMEITSDEDPTCSAPYTTIEEIKSVEFSWGRNVERFESQSEFDGLISYPVFEEDLPNAYRGNFRDVLKVGTRIKLEKQRCGQGQVPYLISFSTPNF